MIIPRTLPITGKKYKCAVQGCGSNSYDNLDVSFHSLPAPNKQLVSVPDYFGNLTKIDKLTAWTKALKVPEKLSSTRMKICSRHFKKEDYYLPDIPTKCPLLLRNAVPTVNLPGSDPIKIQKNEGRLKRRLKRREETGQTCLTNGGYEPQKSQLKTEESIANQHLSVNSYVEQELIEDPVSDLVNVVLHDSQNIDNDGDRMDHNYCARPPKEIQLDPLDISTSVTEQDQSERTVTSRTVQIHAKPQVLKVDKEKQDSGDILIQQTHDTNAQVAKKTCRSLEYIESDEQFNRLCGIESFETFNSIVEYVKSFTKNKWEKDGLLVNTAERVLIVYVKLKQQSSFSVLALKFPPLSESYCATVYSETLKILRECMINPLWPSKRDILSWRNWII